MKLQVLHLCDLQHTKNIAIKVPNGYTKNQAVQPRKMARPAISNEDTRGFNYLSRQNTIMLTCPCNALPITPHFIIVKLGFTGVYIISVFFCSKT